MCIIIHKPKSAKMPSLEMLENCFENNKDGAGFMYLKGNHIHINKGHMTFKAFKAAFEQADLHDNAEVVFHFRIGTQGDIDKHNTHPFPVTDKTNLLRATELNTGFAYAHNGIIPLSSEEEAHMSDSALFSREVLSRLLPRDIYKNRAINTLIRLSTQGSRLLLWHIKLGIMRTGSWTNHEGLFCSNSSFKKSIWKSYANEFGTSYNTYGYSKGEEYKTKELTKTVIETKADSLFPAYAKDSVGRIVSVVERSILDKAKGGYSAMYCDFCGAPIMFGDLEESDDAYICGDCNRAITKNPFKGGKYGW